MKNGRKPPKVVVDTNILVSGLMALRSSPHQLIKAWQAGEFVMVISSVLFDEYSRVLARPKFVDALGLDRAEIAELLAAIQTRAKDVPVAAKIPVAVRDPKDEMVLATAVGGDADYLVTGDDDLLALRDDPRLGKLKIVTVREFLEVLHAQ